MTTTNTTQETRRPFLNRNVGYVAGLNGGKQAYALLMGAYLTTDWNVIIEGKEIR